MLGEKALKYYMRGESCSKCIFKACEDVYGLKLPHELYKMCAGLNNGFGVGAMCSAAATSVMFISYYLAEEDKVRRARIYFLSAVQEKLKGTECCRLKKNCAGAIRECGELLEKTIREFV